MNSKALFQTSTVLPDVIWKSEEDFSDRQLRVGIGLGSLDTPLQPYAINIDGPALHNAREAIEVAAKQKSWVEFSGDSGISMRC